MPELNSNGLYVMPFAIATTNTKLTTGSLETIVVRHVRAPKRVAWLDCVYQTGTKAVLYLLGTSILLCCQDESSSAA
eukprot:m.146111 g.146111  ORF g.146111 m.146111 type:complete len:77 (+) comp16230_c0_seq8:4223-4453(+)